MRLRMRRTTLRSALRRSAVLIAALAFVLSGCNRRPAPSPGLVSALHDIRSLPPDAFEQVHRRLRAAQEAARKQYGIPVTSGQSGCSISSITLSGDGGKLDQDDWSALQAWLCGKGRAALKARGATDEMIGPPRKGVDD